jgi:dipeptidyl aminopeptidase/acylaminoacyl peptidase
LTNPFKLSRRQLCGAGMALTAAGLAGRTDAAATAASLIPLSAWGRLRAVERPVISPDGKSFAFVSDGSQGRQVNQFHVDTDKIAAIGIGSEPVTYLMWADNENVFIVTSSSRHDGPYDYTFNKGGVVDLHTGKQIQIFTGWGSIHPNYTPNYQRVIIDGTSRLTVPHYYMGDESSKIRFSDGLFSVSIKSGRSFDMDIDGQPVHSWAVRPDGTVVGREEYNEATKTWTLRYKDEKGWRAIQKVTEPIDYPVLMGLGRDGVSLLVRFEAGELAGRYCEIDPDGKLAVPFELDGDDNWPIFSNRTYALAGFGTGRDLSTYTFFDPEMQNLPNLVAKALPDSRNVLIDYAEDPRRLIVLSESGDDAGTYIYFDFLGGSFKVIGAAYPNIPETAIARKSAFHFTASDGLEIPGFVTVPMGREPRNLPVVVLPHGGLGSYDNEGFDWLAQGIASRGYLVVQPNYRGSGGYSKAFEARGYGEMGGRILDDLSEAVKQLAANGMADATRAAIVGIGYGGYLALAGATVRPGPYRCAISIGAMANLESFMERKLELYEYDGDASGLMYTKRFFGDAKRWKPISPLENAARAACPIMCIHGEDDVAVLPKGSIDMIKALQKAGKAGELLLLKGEDQLLARQPTRIQALNATVEFLLKHNPPSDA